MRWATTLRCSGTSSNVYRKHRLALVYPRVSPIHRYAAFSVVQRHLVVWPGRCRAVRCAHVTSRCNPPRSNAIDVKDALVYTMLLRV